MALLVGWLVGCVKEVRGGVSLSKGVSKGVECYLLCWLVSGFVWEPGCGSLWKQEGREGVGSCAIEFEF